MSRVLRRIVAAVLCSLPFVFPMGEALAEPGSSPEPTAAAPSSEAAAGSAPAEPASSAPSTWPARPPLPPQVVPPAHAPSWPPPGTTPPSVATTMTYNLPVDLGIVVGGLALWTTLELMKSTLATSCRWCDRDSEGHDTLNGFDSSVRNALRWSNTKLADTWSTIFSFGLAPSAGIAIGAAIAAHDHRMNEFPADLLVVAESAVIALDIDQVTKFAVARERPDVHARTPAERAANHGAGDNLSFFSGHATLAFALSTSAGTLASMRHYRMAPAMWITAMALATTGGYLRIAADKHYASDVVTGAIVGGAVGFAVPYFEHKPAPLHAQVSPMPVHEGAGVMVSGIF
ncbi:MAG TPA: phosphatase PAP2 family protein [Polyangiaceae bacterium]|nr:phosphatase PAP2 family protein [Polyangiaceae bacterium]